MKQGRAEQAESFIPLDPGLRKLRLSTIGDLSLLARNKSASVVASSSLQQIELRMPLDTYRVNTDVRNGFHESQAFY
jgi:hypothetical protein